jgi:hypothetical protein
VRGVYGSPAIIIDLHFFKTGVRRSFARTVRSYANRTQSGDSGKLAYVKVGDAPCATLPGAGSRGPAC